MKITQFTDYSFRLLLFLSRSRDRVATVREVAEYYGISAEHLKKIVRSLSDSGHVQTVRGKNGGLRLAREPSEINLGRLIRDQENLALLPCHEPCDTCPVQGCKLRDLVDEALAAFLRPFDGKTLADII
jgi:Rrf2 family transcriptional regulator, nitric oxide-sensitive transcriptional repressor